MAAPGWALSLGQGCPRLASLGPMAGTAEAAALGLMVGAWWALPQLPPAFCTHCGAAGPPADPPPPALSPAC